MLRVAGYRMFLAKFEPLRKAFQTNSKGRHNVHIRPHYQSHVILLFVNFDVISRKQTIVDFNSF
jgi:hypothetical protein